MTRNQDPPKLDFLINALSSQLANLFLENIFHYIMGEETSIAATVKSVE